MDSSHAENSKTFSWTRILKPFIPKSFITCIHGYNRSLFLDDLRAGISIGCIALPLAMAFAIASGVAPERGLYTAIIGGFFISLLGGSRVQIGGPTGAYVVLVYSTVQKHGYEGLALATLLAGILLVIAGFFRLGALIRFVPYPVTTGFTAGIATVLFVSQIKDFAGFTIETPSVFFFEKISQYIHYCHTVHGLTLFLALATLTLIIVLRRISKKIPAFVLAIIAASFVCSLFDLPVRTIENSIGTIPNTLLLPAFPYISFASIQAVFPEAIAIALLGGIESLLSCIVADNMTGFRHKSNCELLGQGIANIASSLCGGIPATGAIARTGANIQIGAKTPMAGMIHACTILILMLTIGPYAAKMPLCALSAILIVVAWNMSELHHFAAILKGPLSDRIILISTFIFTICIDLTFAVQIGVVLAGFSFLKKMADTSKLVSEITPDGVLNITLNGPFFFGISETLNDTLAAIATPPKTIVLHLASVPFIDSSGIHALKQFQKRCAQLHIQLHMKEMRQEVRQEVSHAFQNTL